MNKRRKDLMFLIIFVSLLCIGISYATLSQKIIINGTATVLSQQEWNVHFVEEHCRALNENELKYKNAYMNAMGTSGTFYAALCPGEEALFRIQIVNEGHIPAELFEAREIPHNENKTNYVLAWQEIDYDFYDSWEDVPYYLFSGGIHTFMVHLECDSKADISEGKITEKHELDWTYLQAEDI